jgi:hypothetical protein
MYHTFETSVATLISIPHINTYERFHIYKVSKQNIQLNDTSTETYNPIYDMICNQIPNLKRIATTPTSVLLHTPAIAHYQHSPFHPPQPTNNNLDHTKNHKNGRDALNDESRLSSVSWNKDDKQSE